ncbi:MAG: LytTR family DNA-binding domain-containing protein [Roseovarius sp.]|nr:LytTR family DNA-binding domain-containing protein [Roseovarius sp.]
MQGSERYFCVWSITEAEQRLARGPFVKSHRSYLINPSHITHFERRKDNGLCHFLLKHVAQKWDPILSLSNMRNQ